ncbi:MAG: tetratricopeptide repeat protein [Gammaproteobacteria bacterium]
MIERLEKMLAAGQDSAALRFGLGNAWLSDDPTVAAEHLRRAVELDPAYSAAWKLLGRALSAAGDPSAAKEAFERGIGIAEERGDLQAVKEMRVFLKRLAKAGDR